MLNLNVRLKRLLKILAIYGLFVSMGSYAGGMCPSPGGGNNFGLFGPFQDGYQFPDGQGGVTLNKTLTLLNGIDEVQGAGYDPVKGEIVFVGEGTIPLAEQIDLDDLVVAMRTIFHVDANGFTSDPGVTFTPGATDPIASGKMDVVFRGATKNTQFGQILYEADYLLKKLGQGVDENSNLLTNNTALMAAAPGYMSAAERMIVNDVDFGDVTVEYWFSPKAIKLDAYSAGETDDDIKSFVFTEMSMQVEVKLYHPNGTIAEATDYPATRSQAQDFATHITDNYDAIAAVPGFEAMDKLKRLGKIVSVVRWLRDNYIPVDLSFMANYVPTYVPTPTEVDLLQLCKADDSNTVNPAMSGPYVVGDSCGLKIVGGVGYKTENDYVDLAVDVQKIQSGVVSMNRVLNAEASEDMSWTFTYKSKSYSGIAQTVSATQKDGNISKGVVDLMYPNLSGHPLALTRYYDSFSGVASEFGPGWSALPFSLSFPESKSLLCKVGSTNCNLGSSDALVAPRKLVVIDRLSGRSLSFDAAESRVWTDAAGLKVALTAIYLSPHSNDWVYENPAGYFVYEQRNSSNQITKMVWFLPYTDENGLTLVANPVYIAVPGVGQDVNRDGELDGIVLEYFYDTKNRLESIEGVVGSPRINVSYNDNRIERVWYTVSDGTREVNYTYNNNRLETVTRNAQVIQYTYADTEDTSSGVISKVENITRAETLLDVDSDLESRATQTMAEGKTALNVNTTYDRVAGSMTLMDSLNRVTTVQRDNSKRVESVSRTADAETLTVGVLYEDSNLLAGPTTVTDERLNTTKYTYDAMGNVTSVTDALGQITTIERGIDPIDGMAVTLITNAKNQKRLVKHDVNGRLVAEHRRVTGVSADINADDIIEFAFTPVAGYSRGFDYDSATGGLDAITNDASQLVTINPWINGNETVQYSNRNNFGLAETVTSAAGYNSQRGFDTLARLRTTQGPADVAATTVNYYASGLEQDRPEIMSTPIGDIKQIYNVVDRTRSVTDPRGVKTVYYNNNKGQLLRVVEIGPQAENVLTSQYFYDDFGKLSYKLLPNGTRIEYAYDGFDRLASRKEIEGNEASNGNRIPTIDSSPPLFNAVSSGSSFSFDVNASDVDVGNVVSYYLVSAPAGMTISGTGLINWTPTSAQEGDYAIVVQVSDGKGGVETLKFVVVADDGIDVSIDNCVDVPNTDQRDTDGDNYGNLCDADLNGDGLTNFADLAIFKSVFGTSNVDADFDGNGSVDDVDLDIIKSLFGRPPGPSGVAR